MADLSGGLLSEESASIDRKTLVDRSTINGENKNSKKGGSPFGASQELPTNRLVEISLSQDPGLVAAMNGEHLVELFRVPMIELLFWYTDKSFGSGYRFGSFHDGFGLFQ